jgi:urease accessory protein
MLIQKKIGHVDSFGIANRPVDLLPVEWYETNKRIMRRSTRQGRELALKFLQESPALTDGDILYADEQVIIAVEILSCETLVIRTAVPQDIAAVCYEIGNRHLPLYISADELLVPFEEPLHRWLLASGYAVSKAERKLLHPLRSTVAMHAHATTNTNGSLFNRILNLTNPRP